MDITIEIGNAIKKLSDATEGWITQQIVNQRRLTGHVCVVISISGASLSLRLATPSCSPAPSGGRRPTIDEDRVFRIWERNRLNTEDFAPGNLIAFLKQLQE